MSTARYACNDLRSLPIATVNCLSVDVEGFVEASLESVSVPAKAINPRREAVEIERNVRLLLELLAAEEIRGTWFFLGWIGRDLPGLIRQVAAAGHEIACHGYHHRRLFSMRPEELRKRLAEARAVLEAAAGTEVLGFRAPDFSITRASLWALDMIREAGFVYDSSIYPIGVHDVYGIPRAEPTVHRLSNGLVEFPLATFVVAGRRLPFGGGGWFRFYPTSLTRALIRRTNQRDEPCMLYVHPYEVGPELSRFPMSWVRRVRHYYNCGRPDRLRGVVRGFQFAPAIDILRQRGFVGTPHGALGG